MDGENVAEIERETLSSIELTRNAKGEYQWKIKAYYEAGHHSEAIRTLKVIDLHLRADYLLEAKGECND